MNLQEALKEIRSQKERKFDQTVDLVINLSGVNLRKENISGVVNIPKPFKEKKVCAFFNEKSKVIDTITPAEFPKYKDKKALKNLVNNYDYFIAIGPLMPSVASTFGKVLGPAGKMPSPQLGIIPKSDEEMIKGVLEKISKAVKVRIKEASVKVGVGKESMKDEDLQNNITSVYNGIIELLPNKKDSVKNVILKTTMGKPVKIEVQ